jgi:PEP-CTERM motif-containing protein
MRKLLANIWIILTGLAMSLTSCAGTAAAAVVVTFDDLTEPTIKVMRTDETGVVTFDEPNAAKVTLGNAFPVPQVASTNRFVLQEISGSVSDTIDFVTIAGSRNYEITFDSSLNEDKPLRDVAPFYGTMTEGGAAFQTIPLAPGAPVGLTVVARSDLDVPEPFTVVLLGSGLAGLVLLKRRRFLR